MVPYSFLTAEEQIEALKDIKTSIMTIDNFTAMTKEYCSILNGTSFKRYFSYSTLTHMADEIGPLLRHLRSIGLITYYNKPDSALQNIVILDGYTSLIKFEDDRLIYINKKNRTWLLAAISLIEDAMIKFPSLFNQGIISQNDIGLIWTTPEYPKELHNSLLQLLEDYCITIRLPSTQIPAQNVS